MRWAVVLLGSVVVGAVTWWAAAGPYRQDNGVAAAVAAGFAGILVAAGTRWANHDDHAAGTGPDLAVPPPAGPTPLVVGDLPGRAVAWQDRFELLDRLAVMADTGRTTVVCALTGQRGIGKTQLAAAYARDRVAQGWPVVVWVVADTLTGIVTGLDALATAAGVRRPDADPVASARAALVWLRTQPGPCLLVYDNAVDPDLIRSWLPPVGAVHTVVTTTRRDFDNVGVPVDVDLFTPAEAVAYLRERTGLADDAGATDVAEHLGRLPLAMACAGAIIGPRRRYRDHRAYLDGLAAVPAGPALPHPSGDPYPHGAAEAILLALDDLSAADPDGAARRLLDRLAVLAPTGAGTTLLRHLAGGAATTSVLAGRSLTIAADDTDRTVVHRLVQRVARDQSHRTGGLDALLANTADRLAAAADSIGSRWATRTLIAEYAQHARTLATHPAGEPAQRRLLHLRATLNRRLGEVHNRSAVIAYGPDIIADSRRLLGPDHPDTLAARSDLAATHRVVGRLDEAIAEDERTAADRERVLGPDHPHTLGSRNNLANGYWAAGRLDEAIALHEQTAADRQRVLGPRHPDTLTSRNNLANAYQAVGRLDAAIALHEQTLAEREDVVGRDHLDTLRSRIGLAGDHHALGRLPEAIALYERTAADLTRVLGPDHPETLRCANNLANAFWAAGRLDEAIALHERTAADRDRVLGPDHPDTLHSRDNLASDYIAAGRAAEAVTMYGQILADRERVLGPDHPDTLTARNNLAAGHHRAGRPAEAVGLHERTLADRERVLGPDHPDTLKSRNNLAGAYWAAGRPHEAVPLYERMVADRERVLGPDHPSTLNSRNNLAAGYHATGRLDEAVALYERAVADTVRVLGPHHPDTLNARHNLAAGRTASGLTSAAIALYEQTVADRRRVLGPDHPDTLRSAADLATVQATVQAR